MARRRIAVTGSISGVDDEWPGSDEHATAPVRGSANVDTKGDASELVKMQLGFGGEVRIELELNVSADADGTAHITGVAKLFEGDEETTTDLEDTENFILQVFADQVKDYTIHLTNPGTGGGDTGDIQLTFTNTAVDTVITSGDATRMSALRTTQPGVAHVVSRRTDYLDVFVTNSAGGIHTGAWDPTMVFGWAGWWDVLGGRAAAGAPVTVVSRRRDFLDLFVVGADGGAYTAAWEPTHGWRGWWRIGTAVFPAGSTISAVSRSQDHLDIFGTDTGGRVLTAAWEPAFTDGWRGWWQVAGGKAKPGAPVTAVSRSADKLDIFMVGTDGGAYTAAWEPAFTDGWRGWWRIKDAVFPQGAYLGATSRSRNKLDVFGTDTGGRVLTAAWEPAFTDGWRGWWQVKEGKAKPGAPVTAVSRSADKLDIFFVGADGSVRTAAWEPAFTDGWHGPWAINDGKAVPGSFISCVSRRADHLNVFAVGTDGRVWTAAWRPGQPWAGWSPLGR